MAQAKQYVDGVAHRGLGGRPSSSLLSVRRVV
jgi:hypothetical protein